MNNSPDHNDLTVFIYSNIPDATYTDGLPGTLLETLSFSSVSGKNYRYVSSGLVLNASSSYWVAHGNAGGSSMEWNYSDSDYSPGPNGATLQHYALSLDGGNNWDAQWYAYEPQLMSVELQAVPEPSSILLIGFSSSVILLIRRSFSTL